MDKHSRYNNYTQLLSKVDAMFAQVKARHEGQFQCIAGCFGCCQAGLTVSNVEATRISSWLSDHSAITAKIRDRSQMLNDPELCSLLDREGRCSIYEVRPVICRSHGMPVSFEEMPEEIGGDVNDHSSYVLTNSVASTNSEGLEPASENSVNTKIDEQRDVCPLNFEGEDLGALAEADVLSLEKLNVLLSLINIQFDKQHAGNRVPLMDLLTNARS